jgi:CheY-like chemotaxis protein
MTSGPPVVAVFNTSPDTIELLRIVLEPAGYVLVGAYTYEVRDGEIDVESLVHQHQPRLIIYDIAPPYDRNWRLFLHIKEMPVLKGVKFLITTTNAKHVREVAGPDQQVFEIVGKPYDLQLIVQAVKDSIGQPRTANRSTSASTDASH